MTIKLSWNQSSKVWHGEEISVTKKGVKYYISQDKDGYIVKLWSGKECDNITVISELE